MLPGAHRHVNVNGTPFRTQRKGFSHKNRDIPHEMHFFLHLRVGTGNVKYSRVQSSRHVTKGLLLFDVNARVLDPC